MKILRISLCLSTALISGCAVINPTTEEYSAETGRLIHRTSAKAYVFGNAKSVAESLSATQSPKSQKVGAKGVSEETDSLDKLLKLVESIKK